MVETGKNNAVRRYRNDHQKGDKSGHQEVQLRSHAGNDYDIKEPEESQKNADSKPRQNDYIININIFVQRLCHRVGRRPQYAAYTSVYLALSSTIGYPADVPCPGPLPSSDLFHHVCELCLLSYLDICFSVPICNI